MTALRVVFSLGIIPSPYWNWQTEKIMLKKVRVLILLALAALVLNVMPAYSTSLTTYTNLASWQAASSGVQTITFGDLTPGAPITFYNTAAGVTEDNVQFIGYNSTGSPYLEAIDTTYSAWSAYDNYGTGIALAQIMDRPSNASPVPYIHVVFSSPVTAFGANLFTNSGNALNFTVSVLGQPFTVATNNLPTPAFWGVTSDTPISSVDFTLQGTVYNGGSQAFIDNFAFGSAQAQAPPDETPEAATFLLIGSGLLGLALLGKRLSLLQAA
jgi:hypothetical protein